VIRFSYSCGHGGMRTAVRILFGCLLCAAFSGRAQEPVSEWDTWNESGLAGWTGGTAQVTVSNPGGWLNLAFKAQATPAFVAVTVRRPISAVWLTNIIFRVKATELPSAVRVCLHAARSGNLWYLNVERPEATNLWNEVSVPVSFDAGWTTGPLRDRQQFERDRRAVDWVGVYLRRGGTCNPQAVALDDVRIRGLRIPPGVPVTGDVLYEGEQAGPIRIDAVPWDGGAAGSGIVPGPGGFLLDSAPPLADCRITAFRDSNTNSVQDVWEAFGTGVPNPIDTGWIGYDGVQVSLQDPMDDLGLPLWWIVHHFGPLALDGDGEGGAAHWGDEDSDADGALNYAEYVSGTDPINPNSVFAVTAIATNIMYGTDEIVLEWPSVAGRVYGLWRTADLLYPFARIASNMPATPPVNRHVDSEIGAGAVYFYRVEVGR